MKLLEEKTILSLTRIKDELPKLAEKNPSIREEFTMSYYGCYDAMKRQAVLENRCGTVGCGLGNAARLFDLDNDAYYDESGRFEYHLFCKAILPDILPNILDQSNTWLYLFNANWNKTEYGDFDSFIKRIENLLKHGRLVNEFSYETNQIIN